MIPSSQNNNPQTSFTQDHFKSHSTWCTYTLDCWYQWIWYLMSQTESIKNFEWRWGATTLTDYSHWILQPDCCCQAILVTRSWWEWYLAVLGQLPPLLVVHHTCVVSFALTQLRNGPPNKGDTMLLSCPGHEVCASWLTAVYVFSILGESRCLICAVPYLRKDNQGCASWSCVLEQCKMSPIAE